MADTDRSRPGCGRPGLLVTEEFVRAIKTEAAIVLKHLFGVSAKAVWNWRRAFRVDQWGTEGSPRLLKVTTLKANRAVRGAYLPLTPQDQEKQSRAAQERIQRQLANGWRPFSTARPWKTREVALLGTAPDDVIARKIGRSQSAVRHKRSQLGIPIATSVPQGG